MKVCLYQVCQGCEGVFVSSMSEVWRCLCIKYVRCEHVLMYQVCQGYEGVFVSSMSGVWRCICIKYVRGMKVYVRGLLSRHTPTMFWESFDPLAWVVIPSFTNLPFPVTVSEYQLRQCTDASSSVTCGRSAICWGRYTFLPDVEIQTSCRLFRKSLPITFVAVHHGCRGVIPTRVESFLS